MSMSILHYWGMVWMMWLKPVGRAGGYIGWQEQCSHSGKPVPFSSLLAPLAPLYNNLLGRQWDR